MVDPEKYCAESNHDVWEYGNTALGVVGGIDGSQALPELQRKSLRPQIARLPNLEAYEQSLTLIGLLPPHPRNEPGRVFKRFLLVNGAHSNFWIASH